ncbi:hypothetical protein HU200_000022 [Digitaria exilis]|uniref:Cytochrome b561 domain-containing protein n=1 Tax=Digitaria exilis TaxID=1010633 RepID=A0A835G3M0_9POAL|nr:hypothetical protein HU200_000022 [Digitaria exilis]
MSTSCRVWVSWALSMGTGLYMMLRLRPMVGWLGSQRALPNYSPDTSVALPRPRAPRWCRQGLPRLPNDHDHTVVVCSRQDLPRLPAQVLLPLTHQHIIMAFGNSIPSRTSSPGIRTRLLHLRFHHGCHSFQLPNRHLLTSTESSKKRTTFLARTNKSTLQFYTFFLCDPSIYLHAGRASVDGSFPYGLRRAHGVLNVFAWGVLMPIGAIVARYFRRVDPLWFYLHVGLQFVGFIIGLAGVVAGVALYNKIQADIEARVIVAFFLRPNADSKYRKFWNWYHHWAGRLALFFAAVNIVLGIHVGGADNSWKIGYGFNLAVILVAVIALEFMLWTRWSKNSTSTPTY